MSLLSDPSRLRIFWLLCHCEECVMNISALVDMSSPAVSHHLRNLKASGLIVSRREGKENARARAAERRKAQAEKLQAEKTAPVVPVLTGSDTPSSDAPSKKKKRKKKQPEQHSCRHN